MKGTNRKTMKLRLQDKHSLGGQTFWLEKVAIVRIKEHPHNLIGLIQKQVNIILFRVITTWK